MTQPLQGVRVIDFTRHVSGPFGSMQLGVMGADVIKIEEVGGEEPRYGAIWPEWGRKGYAPGWLALNANKRSLTLDLRTEEGADIARRLVAGADVVIENFRPGVMAKLGLGYDTLSAVQPRLVYCAISGFGQTGPEARTPGFDGMIQALSGMMSVTGHPQTGPVRTGFAAADIISGLNAAFAIVLALHQRVFTGRGQFVDLSMLDVAMSVMTQQLVECLLTGHVQGQYGNLSVGRRPTADMYPAKSGNIILSVINEKQFVNLVRAVGCTEILEDPRFATWELRIANAAALRALLVAAMSSRTAEEWEMILREADIPCGCVRSLDEALRAEQLHHRNLLHKVDSPHGPLTLLGPGFSMSGADIKIDRAPPLPGQHNDEILTALGYAQDTIDELKRRRIV